MLHGFIFDFSIIIIIIIIMIIIISSIIIIIIIHVAIQLVCFLEAHHQWVCVTEHRRSSEAKTDLLPWQVVVVLPSYPEGSGCRNGAHKKGCNTLTFKRTWAKAVNKDFGAWWLLDKLWHAFHQYPLLGHAHFLHGPFFPAICYRKQKQVFNKKALCATSVTLPPARFGTLELCFWWSTRRCMVIAFSIARTSLSDLSLQASEPNIPPTRSPSTRRWPLESPLRRSEGLFGLFVTPVNCHELSLPPTVMQSCLRIFTVTPNAQDLQKYDLMLVPSSNKIISGFQLLPLDPGPPSTRFSQDPGRCWPSQLHKQKACRHRSSFQAVILPMKAPRTSNGTMKCSVSWHEEPWNLWMFKRMWYCIL